MQFYEGCRKCFYEQAEKLLSMVETDVATARELRQEFQKEIESVDPGSGITAPGLMRTLFRIARHKTDTFDPYRKVKKENNDTALALEESARSAIEKSNDPLLTALRFAICGNIIDHGIPGNLDAEKELENVSDNPFAVFDYDRFKEAFQKAESILYLGDNAGELVFDKLLIEYLQKAYDKKITLAVRGNPILNDAIREDAAYIGIDSICSVIENGDGTPGTDLKYVSQEFYEKFTSADLIISKGQGNFETLDDARYPIFFLFMSKCDVVCTHLKISKNNLILQKSLAYTQKQKSSIS
jgi:uncharacterized protein with ATP-grasp and redox domains